MAHFFKVLGRGVVVTVLLPLILAVWVLYGVYCLGIFIVMFIKSVITFFSGGQVTGEMKEDQEARKIVLEHEKAQSDATQMMSAMYQTALAQAQMQQAMMSQGGMNPMQQPYVQPVPQPQPQQQFVQPENTSFSENTQENADILNENEEGGSEDESR